MSEIVVFDENNDSLKDIIGEPVCEFLLKDAQLVELIAGVRVQELHPGKYQLVISPIFVSRGGNRENSGIGD